MKEEEFKINEAEIDKLIEEYHSKPSKQVRDRLNSVIIDQQREFYKKQEEKSRAKEPSKTRGREM